MSPIGSDERCARSTIKTENAMTEHSSIQDPEDYSDEEMMAFATRLFGPTTPVDELERICMTLAHLPTEAAQHLLRRFRESARASEVSWLECAVDEGAFHLLQPRNDLEEQEFLTLKVIAEIEDEILDLSVQRDQLDLQRRKLCLRFDAVKALVAAKQLDPDEALGFHDALLCIDNDISALDARIEVEEAIAHHLKGTITTARYRNADMDVVRHIHLD
jgi:hypothetical protein